MVRAAAMVPGHGTRPDFDEVQALGIIHQMKHMPGAMLPILHGLQDVFGYIDSRAVPLIAEHLNVSRAEVHGVMTFYHDFRHEKAGRHVLKICRAEACQSMGVEHLVAHLEQAHGITMGKTSADGQLTIENVYCLGNCALGPAALLDGELIGRVDEDQLDQIVAQARTGVQ